MQATTNKVVELVAKIMSGEASTTWARKQLVGRSERLDFRACLDAAKAVRVHAREEQ